MGRTKRFSKFKLPVIGSLKINIRTFATLAGIIISSFAILLFLSFFLEGNVLSYINLQLVTRFGIASFFVPIILIFIASHFFSSKKLTFIKPNMTIGILMIFLSFIGFLQSGQIGNMVFSNLSTDFSFIGALLILSTIFIVGGVLFFNTSLDVLLLFIVDVLKTSWQFLKDHVLYTFTHKSADTLGNRRNTSSNDFIQDTPRINEPVVKPTTIPANAISHDDKNLLVQTHNAKLYKEWKHPPLALLSDGVDEKADYGDVGKNSNTIEQTLESFGIRAKVKEVNKGPTITQYALEIVMGTKLSKITSLSNDLALALAASTGQVRIEAPIPGRRLVGVEIPNNKSQTVTLKSLLGADIMHNDSNPLLVPMGLDVSGAPKAVSLGYMPHALIAGTTGSGKSVMLNAWIASFLFRTTPEQLRLILVDPKRVEFTIYNGIPHLLSEVIVDKDKTLSALKFTVDEMERRYKLFAQAGARNIASFNAMAGSEKLPYIIFMIDELADLMTYAPGEVEELITRIAQMARATGIHLVLATQRPSVDVITGLMKANIPARIAFNVASLVDSRVVLDTPGAEKLLGKGDMLFLSPDQARPRRIQGPFVADADLGKVVEYLKNQIPDVVYDENVTEQRISIKTKSGILTGNDDQDELFEKALSIITESGTASASFLQRRLSVGFARAARLLDQLESAGYIGPAQGGSKGREILHKAHSQNSDA